MAEGLNLTFDQISVILQFLSSSLINISSIDNRAINNFIKLSTVFINLSYQY